MNSLFATILKVTIVSAVSLGCSILGAIIFYVVFCGIYLTFFGVDHNQPYDESRHRFVEALTWLSIFLGGIVGGIGGENYSKKMMFGDNEKQ